ncbi:MAG: argininosuccinate lyase [Pseudomonadota bacterium]|nr:argininosuccinate lyase [Pseudomonadota bacterium]
MSGGKLWGGRFSVPTDRLVEAFSASVQYDRRLYRQDIRGSKAHAEMLAKVGVLSDVEKTAIVDGLDAIQQQIEAGEFEWSQALEDVHMNIEAALTERIGEAGKKLHTARSRNDQVATDIRLYLRDSIDELSTALTSLQEGLVELAGREAETIMPGFTHMQSAQPVTFGHHLLAWFEMLQRDYQRLQECRRRLNQSPLGSAALAGTSFPIDRAMTARALGFDGATRNSLDAVSDRDFVIEFNANAALMMVHLSRMAEEMVLWASDAFGFVDLGDAFCTGSSIMPQKKNPDVAELVRGKCGRVNGNLHALLMLMKGQPLAYNRDNQEDKEPLFDTIDTVRICLEVLAAMAPQIRVDRVAMRAAAEKGFATATDLADYLVRRAVPFRDAHAMVGRIVGYAVEQGLSLERIPLAKLRQFSGAIDEDVFEALTLEGSVAARDHVGGTAPNQVRMAVQAAREQLAARTESADNGAQP